MKLFIAFLFSAIIAFVAAEETTTATNAGTSVWEKVGEDVKVLDKKWDALFGKEWETKVPFFNNIVKKLKEHGIDASQWN